MFGLIHIDSRVLKTSKFSFVSYILKKSKPSSYQVASYSTPTPTLYKDSFKHQEETSNQLLTDQVPALPEHSEEPVKESENDEKKSGSAHHKLNELGPVVVNEDGSISTINNWHEMSDLEKDNVYKMVITRNLKRLEALKKKEQEQQ